MLFCFLSGALLPAASPTTQPARQPVRRLASEVRAEARSGRLVRVVVARPAASRSGSRQAESSALNLTQLIAEAAARHRVDPQLVHSLAQVESNYNVLAVSPKGAQGVMQLMPATARRFQVDNPFDAKANIEGGVRYLRHLLDLYPGNLHLALAAYNAGEGAVTRFGDVPPYPETQSYVRKVVARYGKGRAPKTASSAAAGATEEPAEPSYRPVLVSVDSAGRLVMTTP